MIHWLGSTAMILVAVYSALVAFLYFGQRFLMYHPNQTVADPSAYGYASVEPVWLETEDGARVYAWWKPPSDHSKPVLVYFHGNAGHLGDRADKIRDYANAGFGILLVTYRYNAGAGGTRSEEGHFSDGRAALAFLASKDIPAERTVLYGESLGSGVAVRMAVEQARAGQPVRSVVLEAPYDSIARVAQSIYWYTPAIYLVKDRFHSVGIINEIGTDLLIVHGKRDRVIPLPHAEALFSAAKDPKEFVLLDQAAHNDLYDHGMAPIVLKFLSDRKM